MAAIHGGREDDKAEEDKDEELIRSLRNKGKEDQKVEDLGKIRAEERDNYGKTPDPTTTNPSLLHMTSLVGIDLGYDRKNIEVIQKMEVARRSSTYKI